MVDFIEHEPMRPAGTGTHGLQIQEEFREEMGPIKQGHAQEIDVHVHIRILENPQYFLDAWDASLIANRHETLNGDVVSLRIDDADLVRLFDKTFDEANGQCRLAAS